MIPGSAKRAAFEESLNPFFNLMEQTEVTWKKIPEFTKVSLSFVPSGEDLADSETYAEDTTCAIPTSKGLSPPQRIVLGTVALGVRCLFQDRTIGVNGQKPRTLLTAKVILVDHLPSHSC